MEAEKLWCHEFDQMIYTNIVQIHVISDLIKLNKHFNFHELQLSCIGLLDAVTKLILHFGNMI